MDKHSVSVAVAIVCIIIVAYVLYTREETLIQRGAEYFTTESFSPRGGSVLIDVVEVSRNYIPYIRPVSPPPSIEAFSDPANRSSRVGTPTSYKRSPQIHFWYANWCGACKIMMPVYAQVKAEFSAGPPLKWFEHDGDKESNPAVGGYPTIFAISADGAMYKYTGGADYASLRRFVSAYAMSVN